MSAELTTGDRTALRAELAPLCGVHTHVIVDAFLGSDWLASRVAEAERLQTLINQGAAGALCPDMQTHSERVRRIVAEVEAADARLAAIGGDA